MASKASDSKAKAATGTRVARSARATEAKSAEAKPKRTNSTKAQASPPVAAATSTRAAKSAAKAPTPRRPAAAKAAAVAKPAGKEGAKEDSGKRSHFDRDSLATIRKRLTEQRAELQKSFHQIPSDWAKEPSPEPLLNYEAQQPPLYYFLASIPLRLLQDRSLETRVIILRLISIVVASSAVPIGYLVAKRVTGQSTIALAIVVSQP